MIRDHVLDINHRFIFENGFSSLQKALDMEFESKIVEYTKKDCQGTCQISFNLNWHLYVELDIRNEVSMARGMASELHDIPRTIEVQNCSFK